MRFILFLVFLLVKLSVNAQEITRFSSVINNLPNEIAQFIPEGHVAIDTTYGDINLDGIQDLVLVTCDPDEIIFDTTEYKRPLLLLLGKKDGNYLLAGRNDNVVYCITCGGMMGDPFMGTVIKNGYFSVEHYGGSGWRWTHIITFKYNKEKQNWFLHKVGGDSFHATDPEKVTTKVKTTKDFGEVPFEKYKPEE